MKSVVAWQNFAARVGNLTYDIVRAAEKNSGGDFTKEQMVALALLARTATNLKGVLLLLRHKLIIEARTLARSCFENQFWVMALAEDGERFAQKMIDDDTVRKRQRGQALFEHQFKMEAEVEAKLRRWMRENKSEDLAGSLTPKEVARMGAAKKTYIFYGELSCDAHPSIETLNRYFGKDENGELSTVLMEPEVTDDEIADTLGLASLAVLSLCSGVDDIFGGTVTEALDKLGQEYLRLTKTKGADPLTQPSEPPTETQ